MKFHSLKNVCGHSNVEQKQSFRFSKFFSAKLSSTCGDFYRETAFLEYYISSWFSETSLLCCRLSPDTQNYLYFNAGKQELENNSTVSTEHKL